MPKQINIAIDGFSSTGKSTLARDLARKLNYSYIDTGAMYRAVTLYALRRGLIENQQINEIGLIDQLENIELQFRWSRAGNNSEIHLNGENVEEDIRQMEIAQNVSPVAAISEVRSFLVKQQKSMARHKGVVMDGRDIGTVVMPQADLKIFVTASQEIRVERRFAELIKRGWEITREEVAENLRRRDHIDSTRDDSPLRQAPGARLLDNSSLSQQQQLALVLDWVDELTS